MQFVAGSIVSRKDITKRRYCLEERTKPASDDHIEVSEPLKIQIQTAVQMLGPTEQIHYYVCIVP